MGARAADRDLDVGRQQGLELDDQLALVGAGPVGRLEARGQALGLGLEGGREGVGMLEGDVDGVLRWINHEDRS